MGWVAQKISDHKTTAESLPRLWDSLRDSIGNAVEEFKALISQPGVDRGDCRARGAMCIRVSKPGASIEIFLSPTDATVRLAPGTNTTIAEESESGAEKTLCGYRLKKDRSELEFCRCNGEALTADDVSILALDPFLLDPFPSAYIRPQKSPT
jgi:hypothetical protein